MKNNTRCFTGHRRLPGHRIESITKRLNDEIEHLYRQGVTEYISGGAIGFDQLAAALVISKKELGYKIQLTFALPFKNHDALWTVQEQKHFHSLLYRADHIIYVSEQYTSNCMKKRNHYMIDHSAYCICAYLYSKSGTGQTVRYAEKMGIKPINVAE